MNDFTQPGAATLSQRGEREGSFDEHGFFTDIVDDWGRPRLSCARNYFRELNQEDIPFLCEAFQYWRDYVEFMVVSGTHRVTGEKVRVGVKCSKRGNDVFTERNDRKLAFLRGFEGIKLFSLLDFQKCEYVSSNLLWITLTYNPALCSLDQAWERIGEEWNRFITNLRNRYGKILYLSTPEAFPGHGSAYGYPHIHGMLLFLDHDFSAFPHWEKKKDGREGWVYRIREKHELERQGKWHSHIDVKAIHSGRALGGYLRKHMKNTHGGDDEGALISQAILWLKRKQTFSMSSDFRRAFNDLISSMQGSKTSAQMTLDGEVLDDWIWTFHGIFAAADVGADPGVWVVSLKEELFDRLLSSRGGYR
jgi:hypothetical protein